MIKKRGKARSARVTSRPLLKEKIRKKIRKKRNEKRRLATRIATLGGQERRKSTVLIQAVKKSDDNR